MGSNNYAEVITDSAQAQKVLADLKGLAAQGRAFKVLKFNPDTDRFTISLRRESNLPTLEDVELDGTAIDGPTLSSKLGDAARAIDFGNGYVGLFYESDGLGYMAILNPLDHRRYGQSGTVTERASTPTADGSTSTTGNQETPRMLPTKCSTYTLVETERRLPLSMTADEDDENGLLLLTKIEVKVYGDKVVLEHTDDSMEREPIDITGTALGELLLKADPTK